MAYKIAIFSLNQWSLDFIGNTTRIINSIELAHKAGAIYRAGPELEICGYSVEDGFYDSDTVFHSWQCLLKIVDATTTINMVVDVGMPVQNESLYNCRIIIFRGRILAIRAKTSLANEGNYREGRYFTPLKRQSLMSKYYLPSEIGRKLRQEWVPFVANDFILELSQNNSSETLKVGYEICQELWDSQNVSSQLYEERGCHIIFNGSASYWELRKLTTVMNVVKGISLRGGACYGFSNLIGCDGQRTVFYGRSCIYDRGQLVAMTATCSKIFSEIQMITHIILPEIINEYRAQSRIVIKPPSAEGYRIRLNLDVDSTKLITSPKHDPLPVISTLAEGEITLYVSLWLWDYLRRSRMKGFMMPLSGGLDSSSVALLVYSMCQHISSQRHLEEVKEYFRTIHSLEELELENKLMSAENICSMLLKCCYLSTRYSSTSTSQKAKNLSEAIGANFVNLSLQDIYTRFRSLLKIEKKELPAKEEVTLLDQNLQARLRMVATYFLSEGNRIVLATGNVDEGLMGYLTKYDCSSADINPIGGLCKDDLKSYLRYCCTHLYKNNRKLVQTVGEILEAPPSAELTGSEQRDEDEIGLTYEEISVLGKVRKGTYGSCGPRGAFKRIWECRGEEPFSCKIRCLSGETGRKLLTGEMAEELAAVVKRFYLRYARNRHKCTVLTPALHAETYSPDDNRFDHRQFLYSNWAEQFKSIDLIVEAIKKEANELPDDAEGKH